MTVEFFLVLPLLILVLVAGLQVVSAARVGSSWWVPFAKA